MTYEECKKKVVLLLCEDIFKKHTGTDAADKEVLQQKMEAFGELLLSKPQTKECSSDIYEEVSSQYYMICFLHLHENALSILDRRHVLAG